MNPLNHISERWFWGALYVLMFVWVAYLLATDPGPRPTERVEESAREPDAPPR